MSLEIFITENDIRLEYSPMNGIDWIEERLNNDEVITIKKTFSVTQENLQGTDKEYVETITFLIGRIDGNYYRIFNAILDTSFDVLIHKSYGKLSIKTFVVNNKISIFKEIEKVAGQQITIGGDEDDLNFIPIDVFNDILFSFPTQTEKDYYVKSRVSNVISQYLDNVKDYGKAFEKYLEKKQKIVRISSIPSINEYEQEKYSFILDKLTEMLNNSETYLEKDWQNEILKIILIIYPKYIKCFSNVQIKDYTNPKKTVDRYIDLMLVDTNGSIDAIEIKKPYEHCVISSSVYRDNYVPLRELSGAIMQVEKYIFHLNQWGINGEKTLNTKYKNDLPENLNIKIINPKGFVILGRDCNLSPEQKFDLEIIKRKYANIIDIITYDDLIKRLTFLLKKVI